MDNNKVALIIGAAIFVILLFWRDLTNQFDHVYNDFTVSCDDDFYYNCKNLWGEPITGFLETSIIDKEDGADYDIVIPYKNGKKNGQAIAYYTDEDIIAIEMNFVDDELNGLFKKYYKNGQLEYEEYYKNGERYGE